MNEHSLKYDAVSAMKKLRKAGVSQGQAEAHIEVISGALENVATKSDLEQVEKSLTAKTDQGNKLLLQQMESMNNNFNQRMDSMNDNFNQQMDSMNDNFNQQMDSMKDDFNQKLEKYFYKLLAFLPAATLTIIAAWEFVKDKLS